MTSLDPNQPIHNIGVVERRTGIKADLIRAWERRYGAVVPQRTETARRLYSEADLQRLQRLHQATKLGHRISHIASLGDEELATLIQTASQGHQPTQIVGPELRAIALRCLEAVDQLDASALHGELVRSSFALSQIVLVEGLLVPLMEEIGSRWLRGEIDPSQEHLATTVVKGFVGGFLGAPTKPRSPKIVITTPAGQRHEIGALMAAAMASAEGWQVLYLGPDLPSASIVQAAVRSRSSAVAISVTYPQASPNLAKDVKRLAEELLHASPRKVRLILGGQGASVLDSILERPGVTHVRDLGEFQRTLSTIADPEVETF